MTHTQPVLLPVLASSWDQELGKHLRPVGAHCELPSPHQEAVQWMGRGMGSGAHPERASNPDSAAHELWHLAVPRFPHLSNKGKSRSLC